LCTHIIQRDNIYLKSLTRQNWHINRVITLHKTVNEPVKNNDYYKEREGNYFVEGVSFVSTTGEVVKRQREKNIEDLKKF